MHCKTSFRRRLGLNLFNAHLAFLAPASDRGESVHHSIRKTNRESSPPGATSTSCLSIPWVSARSRRVDRRATVKEILLLATVFDRQTQMISRFIGFDPGRPRLGHDRPRSHLSRGLSFNEMSIKTT